jgi:transposase
VRRAAKTKLLEGMEKPREDVEHSFGTMKACMGATHFLIKSLPKIA